MAQENPQVRRSLDEVEKAYWNPGPSPLDAPLTPCTMLPAIPTCEDAPLTALSLDGEWELAPDGYTKDRVAGDWADAIPARVPGTVHTALLEHGDIPDPMVGRNDKLARENSYRVWWMKRRFSAASLEGEPTLIFEGVCYRGSGLTARISGSTAACSAGRHIRWGICCVKKTRWSSALRTRRPTPWPIQNTRITTRAGKTAWSSTASTAGITPASPPGASGIPCGWRAGRLSAWSGRLWRPGIRRRGWRTSACP